MGHHRNQHPKPDNAYAQPPRKSRRRGEPQDSGVVSSSLVFAVRRLRHLEPWMEGEEPPWSVVEHYLTYGEDGLGVREHARRDMAFAFVLETVLNQQEDARHDDIDPGEGPDSSPADSALEA